MFPKSYSEFYEIRYLIYYILTIGWISSKSPSQGYFPKSYPKFLPNLIILRYLDYQILTIGWIPQHLQCMISFQNLILTVIQILFCLYFYHKIAYYAFIFSYLHFLLFLIFTSTTLSSFFLQNLTFTFFQIPSSLSSWSPKNELKSTKLFIHRWRRLKSSISKYFPNFGYSYKPIKRPILVSS